MSEQNGRSDDIHPLPHTKPPPRPPALTNSFYRERRDALVASVERHLGDFVEFEPPKAGMFLWMRLKGVKDSNDLIMDKAVEKKVLMVPGASFIPTNGDEHPSSSFVRASYSTASVEEMDEACQRLRDLLRK